MRSTIPVEELGPAPVRRPSPRQWLLFIATLLLIEIFDAANDIIRGDLLPPSAHDAVQNALRVVQLEMSHSFFWEPDIYRFAHQNHHLLGIPITSDVILALANNMYAFLHLAVPVAVAGWVFVRHRARFPLLRNVFILTSLVALLGYFLFPVAPPRLTTGIILHGHPFHFPATMSYPRSGLLINGRPIGFNPYAAMPSLHIAWATIAASTVVLLARRWYLRALAALYPIAMALATITTANHYIMDAVGGVMTVCVATAIAVSLSRWVRLIS